ncbi:aminoacyl--tRNA ligase-related protein [Streptomyces sp. NPDC058086]|uniref:aminoacyl--tRNA ligase-related protein n=1 Tax=Streptomyces sp. NPDC058086 TaxID=3346334 RepID=UPI0036E6D7C2
MNTLSSPAQTTDKGMADSLSRIGLRWSDRGYATLTGPLLALARECDQAFLAMAARWAAEPEHHPVLMPAMDLSPVDYFLSFPHLVTFAAPLNPAAHHLQTFTAAARQDPQAALHHAQLTTPGDVLTPAACYHVYVHHRDRELSAPLKVTTRNTCFRHEAYFAPLRRQWSFQMREIVCVGSREEVSDFLSETRAMVDELIALLGLSVEWKAATDPFFDPTANPRYLAQKLHPTKHEACYQDLAIASVNMHEDHFGDAYGISRDGRPATSGCVAFGIERWLCALIDHWGTDPGNWPSTFTAVGGEAS